MSVTAKSPTRVLKTKASSLRRTTTSMELTVSWKSLLRIIVVLAVLALLFLLGRLLELVFLAVLLALALNQIVDAVRRRGLPSWAGVSVAAAVVLAFVALFAGILLPAIANQGSAMIGHLPEVQKQLVDRLPNEGPMKDITNKILQSASFSDPQPLLGKFMAWGSAVLQSIAEFLVILVISIYLLIDGERIVQWIIAFFPNGHRAKVRKASPEIARIVSRFVVGQFITSMLAGTYAFTVLSFLHVPNAMILAVMAACFDILPILGFFIFIVPAVALAFTVSPATAGTVALLYGAYHLLETYLIVPKVYGDRLKLSTLTVLLSCMAGWMLAGVIGAIAILPVVASYPVIEKLWFSRHLEPDTISEHDRIEEEASSEKDA